MKQLLLALTLSILFITSTAYAWWAAQARITVNRNVVTAAVLNNTYRPMYCWGYVYGQTADGVTYQNYSEGPVPPQGGYGYIYVHAPETESFVRGWAQVNCRWRQTNNAYDNGN